MSDDPLDLANLRLPPETPVIAVVPRKIKKRRQHYVQVPWSWMERLTGATGQTWHLALQLLYLHWKGNGEPVKLSNGMLRFDGISRQSKWRALAFLEGRGLIAVERRPHKSPIIRLNLSHPGGRLVSHP
jgi:hypothetical protein